MRRVWTSWCLALALLGGAAPAAALPLTLTLVPSATTLVAGQSFSVAIVIDGLSELVGDNQQQIALESFDLQLQFDTGRLQYTSRSYGTSLGDPNNASQTFLTGPGTPNSTGVAAVGEFSLLTESQLLALQSAPFTLATIQLKALASLGATQLQLINLSSSSLGGVAGRALGDLLQAPSPISVSVVPEPGAAVLGAAALGLLARRRARAARA